MAEVSDDGRDGVAALEAGGAKRTRSAVGRYSGRARHRPAISADNNFSQPQLRHPSALLPGLPKCRIPPNTRSRSSASRFLSPRPSRTPLTKRKPAIFLKMLPRKIHRQSCCHVQLPWDSAAMGPFIIVRLSQRALHAFSGPLHPYVSVSISANFRFLHLFILVPRLFHSSPSTSSFTAEH